MMGDDKKTESFSEALFTYLWLTENFLSENNAAQVIGESSKLVVEVAKAVTVLTSLTIADFNAGLEKYFSVHGISRRSVFTFIATYCFKYHANNEDIFAVFLKTCAFVYKVVLFCHSKGFVEYLDFASMCWLQVFVYDLRNEFFSKGGWDKLEQYVSAKSYLLKQKDSQHKSCMTFFDDVNDLFPNLRISNESEISGSLANSIAANCNYILQNNVLNSERMGDEFNCQNSELTVGKNLFEIKVSDEEAIAAYKLLTSFYGLNGLKSICEQSDDSNYDSFDMEHVYNTLSYFINQGLLQIDASTGKIDHPNIIQNSNVQKAAFCCTNCLHDENETFINCDTNETFSASPVAELAPDGCEKCEAELDTS